MRRAGATARRASRPAAATPRQRSAATAAASPHGRGVRRPPAARRRRRLRRPRVHDGRGRCGSRDSGGRAVGGGEPARRRRGGTMTRWRCGGGPRGQDAERAATPVAGRSRRALAVGCAAAPTPPAPPWTRRPRTRPHAPPRVPATRHTGRRRGGGGWRGSLRERTAPSWRSAGTRGRTRAPPLRCRRPRPPAPPFWCSPPLYYRVPTLSPRAAATHPPPPARVPVRVFFSTHDHVGPRASAVRLVRRPRNGRFTG